MSESLRNLASGAALLLLTITSAWADETYELDIADQELSGALKQFAEQSGLQVVYFAAVAEGKDAPAVHGQYSAPDALDRLLANADLIYTTVDDRTFSIDAPAAAEDAGGDRDPGNARQTPRPVLMVQNQTAESLSRNTNEGEEGNTEEADKKPLEEIVVTGTLIRGIAPESSPLQIYTREDILRSGATTTEQFIRQLPQNFGGGSTELAGQGLPDDAASASNVTFGSGANLRGLGSGGTLVLLNGNRVAPTSSTGDFVDLSMIPVSALERIDVLTDGASSIYGGDAVAGVINFVLRDDYEGAETAIKYGSVADGDMTEIRASQTLGRGWGSGRVLATYEYYRRGNLTLADRPEISAPTLINGQPVTDTDRADLLPEQDRHSVVVALNQDVTPNLKASLTGLYSIREVSQSSVTPVFPVVLQKAKPRSEGTTLSAGLDYDFSDNWSVSVDATYSELLNEREASSSSTPSVFRSNSKSDVSSLDVVLNGQLFALPGGRTKLAVGGHVRNEEFNYETPEQGVLRAADRDVSAVFGELMLPFVGPFNAVPGIERLELNLSVRIDDYSDFGSTSTPKIGALWAPVPSLKVRASYSESFAPPPLGQVGDKQRTGDVFPMSFVALVLGYSGQYPELEAVNLLDVTGIAPNLRPETSETFTAGIDYSADWGTHSWQFGLNYYDVAFEDRLGRVPVPGNLESVFAPFLAYEDPDLFPEGTVIFFPTQAQVGDLVATFQQPVEYFLGATLDNVGVINTSAFIRNLASTETSGFDVHVNYSTDATFGALTAGLNANYITDFTRQATATTPVVEVLNTQYNPVDLKLRGNLGLARGGASTTLFVNYTDGYKVSNAPMAASIGSWTTADLVLSYDFDEHPSSWLRGTRLNVSVQNMFDELPPLAPTETSFRLAGYDPANASPVGRFISLELRKAF
jgi:outer membrane receptor protein involved in Fe transport